MRFTNGLHEDDGACAWFEDNSAEWDMALDKEVLATLLKNYKEHVDAKWLPKFYKTIAPLLAAITMMLPKIQRSL